MAQCLENHVLLGFKGFECPISPKLPSKAHTASFVSSGQLHFISATVLGGYPMVLASPVSWILHCNSGCTLTHSISPQPLFITPSILSLMPLILLVGIWLLCYQVEMQPCPSSQDCSFCFWPWENSSHRFHINDADLSLIVIDSSAPALPNNSQVSVQWYWSSAMKIFQLQFTKTHWFFK